MSNSLYQAQSLWLIAEGARMLIQPLGCIERQDRSTKEMWIRMRCAFSDRSPSLGIKILSIPVPFHIWSSVNIGFPWYNSLIGYQMDSTDSRTTLDSIVQCFFTSSMVLTPTKLVAKDVGLTWMLQSFEASTSAMVINVQITSNASGFFILFF